MEDLEQRMIDAARKGRAEGYGYLMTRYGRRVHLLVSQVVTDARDAEEVAQDAFVRAFERLEAFDPKRGSFGAWIGRIAWNMALNAVRGQGDKGLSLWGLSPEFPDFADNPAEEAAAMTEAERLALLDKAIDRLRPEERTLLHLRYYDGRSLAEIAEVMDTAAGSLASRLQRIRQKLSKLIGL